MAKAFNAPRMIGEEIQERIDERRTRMAIRAPESELIDFFASIGATIKR